LIAAILGASLLSGCGAKPGAGTDKPETTGKGAAEQAKSMPVLSKKLDHGNTADCLALTKDGSVLASAGMGPIKLWDAATGKEKASLPGHPKGVRSLAFSPDGKILASGSEDETVKLWDVVANKETASLKEGDRELRSVAFVGDESTLVSANWSGLVVIWDVVKKAKRSSFQTDKRPLEAMAVSSDGKLLAFGFQLVTAPPPMAEIWDLKTAKKKEAEIKFDQTVFAVAFSPDASTLAVAGDAKTILLVDANTGKEKRSLKVHQGDVKALAFSPDGKTLASGKFGPDVIRLWDVESGQELASLKSKGGMTKSMIFSPDGKTLFVAGFENTIEVWDVAAITQRK